MVVRRLSIYSIAAVLMCAAAMGSDTCQPVSHEALRLAALRAVFPGMQVLLDRNKRIDNSWPKKPEAGELYFPDALAAESVYAVIGPPMNEAENTASENMITEKFSNTRQLRFRLFRWPRENDAGLLAVLQYDFRDASPAGACPSIGLLVHLVRHGANWAVKEQYLLETVHHHSLQSIRLLDLTGKGADELVVESSVGGAGTSASGLQVFDLSQGRLDAVLDTPSRMQYMTDDWYTQTLDLNRTRENHGQRFCFSKAIFFEHGEALRPPRVTRPCYERGDGVEPIWATERNKKLTASH
jgi:hypothetical protein